MKKLILKSIINSIKQIRKTCVMSQFVDSALHFSMNLLSCAIFRCHEHPSGRIEWALKQYWQLVVQMRALNPEIMPHRESINHLLFSWQSLQATSHQHDWRSSSEEKWRAVLSGGRCPSWITVLQMVLLSMTTAFCYSSLASFLVLLMLPMKRKPYFTVLFTYSCNNPQCSFPFTFILILRSIYDKGLCGTQHRQRVMNKLRIRTMVESSSEVTCISLSFSTSQIAQEYGKRTIQSYGKRKNQSDASERL